MVKVLVLVDSFLEPGLGQRVGGIAEAKRPMVPNQF